MPGAKGSAGRDRRVDCEGPQRSRVKDLDVAESMGAIKRYIRINALPALLQMLTHGEPQYLIQIPAPRMNQINTSPCKITTTHGLFLLRGGSMLCYTHPSATHI